MPTRIPAFVFPAAWADKNPVCPPYVTIKSARDKLYFRIVWRRIQAIENVTGGKNMSNAITLPQTMLKRLEKISAVSPHHGSHC